MHRFRFLTALLAVLGCCCPGRAAEVVPLDTTWRFQNGLSEASSPDTTAWRALGFDDSSWAELPAPFWYGDVQPAPGTELTDMRNNYRCVFLRKTFAVGNPGDLSSLTLGAQSDDGFVAWINGHEVGRFNMPGGEPTIGTDSLPALPEPIAFQSIPIDNPRDFLVTGTNVLTVQGFNSSLGSSSDFVLNLSLSATLDTEPPVVERLLPSAGAEVRSLDSIEVLFDEPVSGVDAADLRINSQPATNVTVFTDRQYVFTFPRPGAGTASVAWAPSTGITDLAGTPHPFAGGSWSYVVNPNLAPPGVVISEFMADNDRTLNDEDGESSDWIELYNAGTSAVNLSGWYLTDDTNHVAVWRIPAVSLNAGAYRLIFASGKNRTNPAANLHTNFKLNQGGGYLALLDTGRNVVSEFRFYPAQLTDVSYGRLESAPSVLGYYPQPTPGGPNGTSGPGFAPEVRYGRPGGTFMNPFTLSLTAAAPGAEIRYTLDGTIPTSASTLYTGPLNLTTSVLVRARTFAPPLLPGPVSTEGYVQLGASVINANSDLPYIILHNFGRGAWPASNPDMPGFVAVFEPGANGRSSMTNAADFTSRVGANIRGSSTQGYPKSSYAVEMWAETDADHNKPLLGMPSESDWVFYAPNNFEPVLIHNPFAHALSRQVGRYSPRTRWAEVYVNTGTGALSSSHYMGIYAIEEKIKRSPDRVDIDRLEPEHSTPPAVTGGYLMKIDRSDADERTFYAAGQGLVYQDPAGPDIQDQPERQAQEDYLSNYLDTYYNELYAADWTNTVTGYPAYIDVDAAIDHHLLNVLTFNVDALRLSGFMYKPRNGKLTFGPLWDFDRALNSTDGRDANPRVWRSASGDLGTDFFNYPWWDRMFQDPDFWQRYVDRYQNLRTWAFANTNLNALVDALTGQVREAQPREQARWGSYAPPRGGFQGEITSLKTWLANRTDFMDTNFLTRPQLSAPGGPISSGFQLTLTPAAKTGSYVVYTLDGTDPRRAGGSIASVARSNLGPVTLTLNANTRVVARSLNGSHANLTGANKPPISTPWSGSVAATYVVTMPQLVITEIMYHPAPPPAGNTNDADAFEYVELRNTGPTSLDLRGVSLAGGVQYTFTNSFALAAGQRVLVVSDPVAFATRYGAGLVLAPGAYRGHLANDGDHLVLSGPLQEPLLDFEFHDGWYAVTDGPGFSLVAVDEHAPAAAWSTAAQWRPSGAVRGTPGAAKTALPAFPTVLINEALTHTDPPQVDTVELHNAGLATANVGGWLITDDFETPAKFRIPPGTSIAPGGFLTFTESDFSTASVPFLLSSLGDQVWLFSADLATTNLTGYVQGFEFGAAQNGVSFGRYTDSLGRDHFVAESANSLAATNAGPRIGPVVINELMIDPRPVFGTNNNTRDEFIELRNITGQPAPLFDPAAPTNTWRLGGAVEFTLPPGLTLPPGGHLLVVGFDPTWSPVDLDAFRAVYGLSPSVPMVGPYQGNLDNAGDHVKLFKPDPPQSGGPDAGFVPQVLVDSVHYDVVEPWPTNVNATGLSLQRVTDAAFGDDPINWQAATPTPGAANPTSGSTNLPPVLAAVGNRSGPEGILLTFTLSAIDPNGGQTLSYSLDAGAPAGAALNASSGVFTWTPTEAQGPGTYPVTFRVSDNGSPVLSDFETVTLTITEANLAPSLGSIGNRSVSEGATLSFTATGSDPDLPAQALTYSLDAGAPAGAAINATTGAFTWTPTEAQGPGTYPLTVRVTDNGSPALADSETVTLTVLEVNVAPTLSPVADQRIAVGDHLWLTLRGADADLPANVLTFALEAGAPTGVSLDASSGLLGWSPSAGQVGTNLIGVRVTDDGAPPASGSGTVRVVVTPVVPISFTEIRLASPGELSITWQSEPGKTYELQYQLNLGGGAWTAAGQYLSTGTTTTATNRVAGAAQRYYRLQRLN
jgi:hypothetical protein